MADNFEEENLDILQNIEASIVGVFHEHPELTDYQVDSAMEALGRTYINEKRGGGPVLPKSDLSKEVYQAMKSMCDWRLGRESVVDEEGQPMTIEPVSIDLILTCLKKLRKSLSMWNKEAGTQGYLKYIKQFLS